MSGHAFEIIPLTVEARGEIIVNNLPEFRDLVREALSNINRDLKTDEDFGQAELDVKALKHAEDTVRAAAIKAFDDKLKALVEGLNDTAEEIRAPRLELEKLIAKRKDEVKAELIAEAMGNLDCAPRLRQATFGKSVSESIKGKRTLDSMRKALHVTVSVHNAHIARSRAAIASFEKAHGMEMTMDREELEVKSQESVEVELRRRFEAKKANAEKKRLEEEAAKAKAEAQAAKAEAEAARNDAEHGSTSLVSAEPSNVVPMKGTLPESDLPKPPKIGGIPTGPSPIAEWAAWITSCKTTFGVLKVAKESLKHPDNIRRAAILAEGVNAAWKAMQEAVEEVAQ